MLSGFQHKGGKHKTGFFLGGLNMPDMIMAECGHLAPPASAGGARRRCRKCRGEGAIAKLPQAVRILKVCGGFTQAVQDAVNRGDFSVHTALTEGNMSLLTDDLAQQS